MYEYNGSRFYDLFPDNDKWEFTQLELKLTVVEIYSLKRERKLFYYHIQPVQNA